MIQVIDYGCGNLFSLSHALAHLHIDYKIISTPEDLTAENTVLLPGVGSFAYAMQQLAQLQLISALQNFAHAGGRLVGICLGMQLLMTMGSEFGQHAGLDLIAGGVEPLPMANGAGDNIRIPNTGWRQLHSSDESIIQLGMGYFVHSFAVAPNDASIVIATIDVNSASIPAVIKQGNITGIQFHPEKSAVAGLQWLRQILLD